MQKWAYFLTIPFLILFFILLITFNGQTISRFDEMIAQLLHGNALIIFFHYFGETNLIIVVALAMLIGLWVRQRNYRGMIFVLLTVGGGNVLNQLVKRWVERPRPDMIDQLTSYSFPSGHAMVGLLYLFTVIYLLSELLIDQKRLILLWSITIVFVMLIGLSRIAESRHYASDVIAGWSLGYSWFILCALWYENRKRQFNKVKKQRLQ